MSLVYEKKDNIAYLTINRPEVHNAIDPDTAVALFNAWKDYRDDDHYCKAMEIMLTGEWFSAHEALKMGLVNHVVAPEDLMSFTEKIARKIVSNGPFFDAKETEQQQAPINKRIDLKEETEAC